MSAFEIVGLVAALLTTASFLPQVAHSWRSGSARDISAAWLLLFGAGIALWFVYGLAIAALPVILANGITFLLLLVIAWIKFMPRRPA
ncbi:MAG: SemiSWEET transporter [Alphaproteobacteria bacterium]|nr:SemiSWEET transporter [Alphaproteobacteria bacterium]